MMNKTGWSFIAFLILLACNVASAQDSSAFKWKVNAKKIGEGRYELNFSTRGNPSWELYAPNQDLSGVPTTEIQFGDSIINSEKGFKDSGNVKTVHSNLFGVP